MLLCLDVGNSQIYGGVFENKDLKFTFRLSSSVSTSDEFGVFLKAVLRENECPPEHIKQITVCSVVPQLDYSLRSACIKYFEVEPFFLNGETKTNLQIKYNQPNDVGADRIANALGATHQFPNQNLIIIDFGTATTFCVVTAKKEYLGGAILPGMRLSAEALSLKTAKLPSIELIKAKQAAGDSTVKSIQSGLYYGSLGACRELIARMKQEVFSTEAVLVIATGGFSPLFDGEKLYDHRLPNLVLDGLRLAVST